MYKKEKRPVDKGPGVYCPIAQRECAHNAYLVVEETEDELHCKSFKCVLGEEGGNACLLSAYFGGAK